MEERFLMNVVHAISQAITPSVLNQIAGLLGASQDTVQKALTGAVPGVLAAVLSAVSNKQGTDAVAAASERQDRGMLDNLPALLEHDARAVAATGSDLLSSIIGGGRMGVLASKLKDYAGLPEGTSGALLGVVGSMALGALGKAADARGLDANGVAHMLEAQKDDIARSLPGDFANTLQGVGLLDAIADRLDLLGSAGAAAAPPGSTQADTASLSSSAAASSTSAPGGAPTLIARWWRWALGIIAFALLLSLFS